jgi:hypothetical protein
MLRLNRRQREVLIEKLPDVANLVAASTSFGQFLADRPFSTWLALGGVTTSMLLWLVALLPAEEKR